MNAHKLKRIVAWLALAGFAWAAAGCNTVAGMGQDIDAAGHAIKKAAQ
ncbi:entericidin A/B family lipoprotein [Burkholderia sp. TSV86]|nr:entericidin A/B family lipoprotein [Burkholderia sp. TSV86]KVE32395.1 entericidin [Burkholderia sp. TSV86]